MSANGSRRSSAVSGEKAEPDLCNVLVAELQKLLDQCDDLEAQLPVLKEQEHELLQTNSELQRMTQVLMHRVTEDEKQRRVLSESVDSRILQLAQSHEQRITQHREEIFALKSQLARKVHCGNGSCARRSELPANQNCSSSNKS
eukprot:TRINITY_DN14459_c0_g1_i2.p1 TRINITY_DN14459_c0_g1~~TRINITY_DN14459_c0_g1_i2.p1  ORF type:complete len:153 (-),score=28.92 TRINITY_DN14459_c0_g1_i2:340-771(-)